MPVETWLLPEIRAQILRRRPNLHPLLNAFDPATTALLIIDMQTGFLDPKYESTALPSAEAIVPAVNRLSAALRKAGGCVVWVTSTYGPAPKDLSKFPLRNAVSRETAEQFCRLFVTGHDAHSIWPLLERRPEDLAVTKNCFAAFYGSGEQLTKILRDKYIETVLIAGLQTSICCETTAREANVRGFGTIMVEDANAGRLEAENRATYSIILRAFGDVLSTNGLIRQIEAR
jgi:ureidoacrylate peracid hydrolase